MAGGARTGDRRLEEHAASGWRLEEHAREAGGWRNAGPSLSPPLIFGMPETHILQKTHFPDIVLRFRSKEIESFIPLGFIWSYIYCCAILMFGI
jgi:hypothetical protein